MGVIPRWLAFLGSRNDQTCYLPDSESQRGHPLFRQKKSGRWFVWTTSQTHLLFLKPSSGEVALVFLLALRMQVDAAPNV